MPNNKYIINESQLVDIADAIRTKLNEQDTYTVDEMPGKIESIENSFIVYIPEQTVTLSHDSPVAEINTNLDPENPVESIPISMEVGSEKANFTLTYGFHQGIGSNSYYFINESMLIAVVYDDEVEKWVFIYPIPGDLEVTISSIAEENESLFSLCTLSVIYQADRRNDEIKITGPIYITEPSPMIISEDSLIEPGEVTLIIPNGSNSKTSVIINDIGSGNIYPDNENITEGNNYNEYYVTGDCSVTVVPGK